MLLNFSSPIIFLLKPPLQNMTLTHLQTGLESWKEKKKYVRKVVFETENQGFFGGGGGKKG